MSENAALVGVIGFNHFSVSVADIDASLRFYRDLLGLTLTGRGRVQYPHLDRIVGHQDTDIEWAELEVPGGGMLELFRYHQPQGRPVDSEVINPGTTHLAFTVDNIHELTQRLQAHGAQTMSGEPVEIPFGDWAGWLDLYVKDPDGVMIELSQHP